MTHGQPRIMRIRRRHPIRPTVWGMPSVGKGEAPFPVRPQPSASLTPPHTNHSRRRVACSTNHFRSFVAFLFLEVCLHGAFWNIVRLGSQVFPSFHAWPVDACTPHSPLCFDKFTIAAAQNPRKICRR